MQRNKGAMDNMSKSLEGLQSTYDDTKMSLQAGFSSNFMEGEKAGIKSSIAMMESVQPVAEEMGKAFGDVSNWWERMKNKAVESVTSIDGFSTAITWLIKGVIGLAAAFTLTAGASMAAFVAKILMVAAGNKAAAQSTMMLNAAQGSSVGVMAKLQSIKISLLSAIRANAAGLKAEAVAHMQAAGAATRNIVSTNGVTAATKVAGLTMRGMAVAIRFVGAQFKALAVGMLANPLFLIVAGLVAVGMALKHFSDQAEAAKKKQDEYAKSTDALLSKMDQETREIRTKIDLRRQEAAVISELSKAYDAMETTTDGKMKDLAAARIEKLREQLGAVRGQSGKVEKSENQYDRDSQKRADAIAAERSTQDIVSERGPEQALAMAEKRLAVIEERRRAAIELEELEAAAEKRADAATAAGQEDALREQQILRDLAKTKSDIVATGSGEDAWATADENAAALEKKIVLEKELAEIQSRRAGGGGELSAQLDSGSEQMVLNAKIAAYDQMIAAANELTDAHKALADAEEDGRVEAQKNLDIALKRDAATKSVANQAGVSSWGANDRKEGLNKSNELEARRADDTSEDKAVRAAEEKKKLAYEVIRARLDGEAAVDSIAMKGDDREARLLEIEREKLELKKQGGLIAQQSYDRESAILTAKMEALSKEAKEKRDMIAQAMVLGHLQRKLGEAQRTGETGKAAGLRAEIAKREYEIEKAAALRDAKEMGGSANQEKYVKLRMEEYAEQQKMEESARKRDEAEKQNATRSGVDSGMNGMQARLMKLQGNHEGAKALMKQDERKQDEQARVTRAKQLREEGFSKDEANGLPTKEMKISQGERILSKLFEQKGTVVAGSLAAIGGGGGVYGNDPQARALEKATRVLEQIRDNTRETVEDDW